MRYFPQRAQRKSIERSLNICTFCLGDMFADDQCVQCHARVSRVPLYERLQLTGASLPLPRAFPR